MIHVIVTEPLNPDMGPQIIVSPEPAAVGLTMDVSNAQVTLTATISRNPN
jgi:hypothetical protein